MKTTTKSKTINTTHRISRPAVKIEKPAATLVTPTPTVELRPIDIAREHLKELSKTVKPLVDQGKFETINEAILETIYKDGINQEFKSYSHWKEDGYQVRKGEKAFTLWGKPKENAHEKEGQEKDVRKETDIQSHEDDAHTFFPVAFIFSNAQVDLREQSKTELENLDNLRENAEERDIDQGR
jgi:hypothetical protein